MYACICNLSISTLRVASRITNRCVYVCVREREREREKEYAKCVCMYIYVYMYMQCVNLDTARCVENYKEVCITVRARAKCACACERKQERE